MYFPRTHTLELALGVQIKVKPYTTLIDQAARAYARRNQQKLEEDYEALQATGAEVIDLPDLEDPDMEEGLEALFYIQGLAQKGILEWEGVADKNDEPAELTEENINHLMLIPGIATLFRFRYMEAYAEVVEEGNGFEPASNGTSSLAAGSSTAPTVDETTSTAAEEKEAPAANAAPTSSTS